MQTSQLAFRHNSQKLIAQHKQNNIFNLHPMKTCQMSCHVMSIKIWKICTIKVNQPIFIYRYWYIHTRAWILKCPVTRMCANHGLNILSIRPDVSSNANNKPCCPLGWRRGQTWAWLIFLIATSHIRSWITTSTRFSINRTRKINNSTFWKKLMDFIFVLYKCFWT